GLGPGRRHHQLRDHHPPRGRRAPPPRGRRRRTMNDEAASVRDAPEQTATIDLPDAEATRAFGRELAQELRAGDLVLLTGDLGAGKTTLTQGIGAGLGVRGQVASPTFVI